jgi:hypothetical protein
MGDLAHGVSLAQDKTKEAAGCDYGGDNLGLAFNGPLRAVLRKPDRQGDYPSACESCGKLTVPMYGRSCELCGHWQMAEDI